MAEIRDARGRNAILSDLLSEHFELLEPHLEHIQMPLRHRVETANSPPKHVVFPLSGMVSVVDEVSGELIEVGIVGREGMVGLLVVMGRPHSPFGSFCQLPGEAVQIAAPKLLELVADCRPLERAFVRFAYDFIVQISRTAMANGRGKLEERLSRWLLMVADRCDGDGINLTHEFLSHMLGVHRPGVTMALGLLEQRGLIIAARGAITIVDREGLEQAANGFYSRELRA